MHVPGGIVLDNLGGEGTGIGVFAIFDLESSQARELVCREGEVVFILRLLVDVLYQDIDVLLDKVFLHRYHMDQIGILENLGGLECGRKLGGRAALAC